MQRAMIVSTIPRLGERSELQPEVFEVFLDSGRGGLHGLLALFPVGRAHVSGFLAVLERVERAKNLVDVPSQVEIVDGLVARRRNQVTTFGKFLDPLADKVLIGSILIMLVQLGWVPAWIAIVIIARELTVTGLRAAAADKGMVIGADKYGKMKTFLQIIALCLLMLHYPWFQLDPVPAGKIMLYIALGMTVFSGANYLYNFYRIWLNEESGG